MPRPTRPLRTRTAACPGRLLWGALLVAVLVSVLGVPRCATATDAAAPPVDVRAGART
ncbi:hypothetical protein G3I40_07070, partial [Streptomyces sp. SID14478]|nr:hypothetical protein [Streptomyces sp. SID14478]